MRSFITALLLAGAALAAPANPETTKPQTCTSRSTKVRDWKVEDFDYHASYVFSTPAHQNSWGYVNFTLVNPVLHYKTVCQAASSQLQDFFYGQVVYKCTTPNGYGDEATFTFSRPSGELKINQTWYCPNEGSHFEAHGGVHLDLKCNESKWQNDHWKIGQIYSTRNIDCAHVDVQAKVTEMSGVA
ncbi:hypothetical protein CDD83_5058 [Cordyceps sp. RAO-2017]|nr:hypothetical protein CDD83_5058 [Cordyceps sp. RAO-2017]